MTLPAAAPMPGPDLAEETPAAGGLASPRLIACGVALLLHGGMAGLLLLSPATTPSLAMPEPVLAMLVAPAEEPVVAPPPPEPEPPVEAAAPQPAEPTPPPPEPPPPEPEPPPPMPEPPPPEPPPPEPPPPEPPPPEPMPVEPPPPAPPEPLPLPPEPAPEPPPEPRAEPPPAPAPRPRPRPVQRVAPAPAAVTAPSAPVAAPVQAPAPRPAAGAPPSYLRALLGALERQKRYPDSARSRRATGTATLRFTVLRDGRVARWQIVRSAGDGDLDRAVEAMITRASLPPMPADMAGDSLDVAVPVRFELR
jgi:protein TonB